MAVVVSHLNRTLWVAAAGLLMAGACLAAEIQGRVVGVADGDTVTVLDAQKVQHKVRLSGIDAPEKSQPFGADSKRSLSDQVFGHQVTVITDKKDRYGRDVGKVMLDGQDVNLEQVRRGMAWVYPQYLNELSPGDQRLYQACPGQPQGGLPPIPRTVCLAL